MSTLPKSPPPMGPWPFFANEEIEAVQAVLSSGKVNYWGGQEGRSFETEYATYVGVKHAVAHANGTVTLENALQALGIGPQDEVIGTPRTFIASSTAVIMRNATSVLADIDRDSQNITAETIEAVLTPRTKAIVCVHLAGWPCDMDAILDLANDRGIAVIEDCAQAHGARYKGRPVGGIGSFGSFSFCQDKILTTGGEGGMLVTDDRNLWSKAWSYKDHGKNYDTVYNTDHPPGFRWLHEGPGTNWRLTEMQSAIGRVILRRLPQWVEQRRANAAILDSCLNDCPAIRLPKPPDDIYHAYYKYYVFIQPENLASGWTRDRIRDTISEAGVPCYSGSCSEIYLEKGFPESMRPPERLPVAKELGETSLMLLVHPTLSEEFVRYTGETVRNVLDLATK